MAKFCSNCGSRMEDEDRVCGQCGTPVDDMAAPLGNVSSEGAPSENVSANVQPTVNNDTQQNKISTDNVIKIVIVAAAVFVLIVVASVGIKVVGSFTGYKGTLNKMVKALQKNDMDTLESVASDVGDELYESWYGNDYYDRYEDMVSDVLDKYEDRVGTIKKITYEITDETEMSERKLSQLEDDLDERYDINASDVEKVVEVDLKITVKGSKKSHTYNVKNLNMIKESDGWKVFYGSLDF